MIPNNFIDFYGDQTRWFVGVVVDLQDPKKLGRVKVRVFGVYDDIKDKDLPWAQIVVPITAGVNDGNGQYLGLLKDSQVFGMFLDGQNSQLPMVIGTIPKEGDTNSKAEANYPHNKVYQTTQGHYKEYDDTPGSERIKEHHKTGSYYELQADGSRKTVIKVNDTLIVEEGDINITVQQGNVTINVDGNVTANVGGNFAAKVGGSTTVDCSNTTITGELRVGGGISVANDVITDRGISLNDHLHLVKGVKPGPATIKSEKPL